MNLCAISRFVYIVNFSILKNDRARAIRFSVLKALCDALDGEVGGLVLASGD